MKIQLNGYTYFNPASPGTGTYNKDNTDQKYYNNLANTYSFKSSIFNDYIANGEYDKAADYASQYHFDDVEKQRDFENNIINLRNEAKKINAIYGKVKDKNLAELKFIDNVFENNGLERLKDNKFADNFKEYKRSLFQSVDGMDENGDVKYKDHKYLSISFDIDGKRTFLGMDFLAKDNSATIDNFYKTFGLSEAQLKSAGVNIVTKDGKKSLIFDSSNSMANRLIYYMSKFSEGDSLLNKLGMTNSDAYENTLIGVTDDINTPATTSNMMSGNLESIRYLIDEAQNKKDNIFRNLDATEKDYSSTIGPALDDNLEYLNQALATNKISQQEYNQQVKLNNSIVDQAVRSLGSGNYEMYSNVFNKESTDETLISLDNEQRSEIIQSITAANPKDLHFNAMISNGQIGTLITVDADEVDNKNISDGKDINKVKRRRRQVFIPGFMYELAQKKINQNTSTRAVNEINSMQDYGYGFKTDDGREIYASGDGRFFIDGEEISKDSAVKAINKSLIIQDATNNLKYQYSNNSGDLYDKKGYEETARLIAIKAANELDPFISFGDNTTVADIFDKKGAGPVVSDEYSHTMQYELFNKYNTVFDIYDKIMAAIFYYNN